MPGPDEKVDLWEFHNGRFSLGKKTMKLSYDVHEFWIMMDTDVIGDSKRYDTLVTNHIDDAAETEGLENIRQYQGSLTIGGESFALEIAKGYEEDARQFVKEAVEKFRETAKFMRGWDDHNPNTRLGGKRLADWADHYANLMSIEDADIAKAMLTDMTTTRFLTNSGGFPKMMDLNKLKEIEKNPDKNIALIERQNMVKEMVTKDVEGMGPDLFNDYMDYMDGCLDKWEVAYHKQAMEKDGWDPSKEKTYLDELKIANEKIINSVDKICKIDDHREYDKYINNGLGSVTGNHGKNERDPSCEVGYLKGENRAIEMGYPSDELMGLGFYGQIQGYIDRENRQFAYRLRDQNEKLAAATDEKKIQEINTEIEKIKAEQTKFSEVEKEFSELKAGVWDDRYPGTEAVLEQCTKANDFLQKHGIKVEMAYYQDLKAQNLEKLSEKTADAKALSEAMSEFNTKRTDMWLSSESKVHKELRESAETLQQNLKAYQTGVYQDGPKKGKFMSTEERQALKETIKKNAEDVSQKADAYLESRKSQRSTVAGQARKEGAEKLANFANEIQNKLHIDPTERTYQTVMDAVLPEERSVMTNALDHYEDAHQKQMEKNYRLGYDTISQRAFKNDVAKKIAIHSIRQGKKDGQAIDERRVDEFAKQIGRDPAFQKMMSYDSSQAASHEARKQFVDMTPGEVFAKFALTKQSMKLQQELQKNTNQPEKNINNPVNEKTQPKPQGMKM